MLTVGSIGFASPWLLAGLALLPVLWILLRAVPPAPIRRRFPGVALLLGLSDDDSQTDRTPWWLLLLRTLAIAAAILAFAGPVLNPRAETRGTGPLLVLIDGTWADAATWPARMDRLTRALNEATAQGRETAVVLTTDLPDALPFRSAEAWKRQIAALVPAPYVAGADEIDAFADRLDGRFETLWLSDGLARPWRDDLLATLEQRGPVTVYEVPRPVFALGAPGVADGALEVVVQRAGPEPEGPLDVAVWGPDPSGTERRLAGATATFAPGAQSAEIALSLPPEVRNRVTKLELTGIRSAAAVALTDDALRRREVALLAPREEREGLQLLSPLHYLEQALAPSADLIDGALSDVLLANPDAIVLVDLVAFTDAEREALIEWMEGGGLLLRFAGPRLAASEIGRGDEDPLLPVRLRAGGRSVGGAMSWGEPKRLRAFAPDSPFFGLAVPDDVTISAQVMAQPDPALAERTIAALADGTPLVTRKRVGAGQVVLVHTTANADWSTLPLSGLFVGMLERLALASGATDAGAGDDRLEGTTWNAVATLDAFGELRDEDSLPGVPGPRLRDAPGRDLPPGLYVSGDVTRAVNAVPPDTTIEAYDWPSDVPVEGLAESPEIPLKGLLLGLAALLLAADVVASLLVSGRGLRGAVAGFLLAMTPVLPSPHAAAQTPDDISVAAQVRLAYVETGDPRVDAVSRAGLQGLSTVLFRRTSVEPGEPVGVNLETDELALHPFLYWPITPDQPRPSDEAYGRLNRYLATGGLILFDTRDADTARFGASSPNARRLQELALPLDIPPLEPLPEDHVLTRTFYLLQDFPGRHVSRDVWVEAAPADAERAEGMPFRNLNDNVTPVVVGGNDWAAAWAVTEQGQPMFPVGRGFAGERQREIAVRFGVNLVMHVLTGNYKSDQVHVPALLDRLGQ